MLLSRWQPYHPLWNQVQQLQDEMNRVFQRYTPEANRLLGFTPSFPALNVLEDGDNVLVEAELPGLDQNDLEIFVTGGNQLTLKGERKRPAVEKSVWHRQERGVGKFVRVVTLPFAVDAEHVDARFESGVLTVKLAKHEQAKPRKIQVKAE